MILNTDGGWAVWALYIISTLGGIGVSVLFVCFEKIAFYGGGGFLGVIIGFELYSLIIYKADVYIGEPVMFYVTIIVLGLVFVGLTYWLHDKIWICATGVGGSYLFVKTVGKMIGDYPDERNIAAELRDGQFGSMPAAHWIYLACSVVLSIVAIIFQCVHMKRRANKRDGDYENVNEVKNVTGNVYIQNYDR